MLVDRDHPEVCPALDIANMVLRKASLKHDAILPLAIFQAKDGIVQYFTHSKATKIIRKTVEIVYPDVFKKKTNEVLLPLNQSLDMYLSR